jgi:hypothetical protein
MKEMCIYIDRYIYIFFSLDITNCRQEYYDVIIQCVYTYKAKEKVERAWLQLEIKDVYLICYHWARQEEWWLCSILSKSIFSFFSFLFHTQIIIILHRQSDDKRLKIELRTAAFALKSDHSSSIGCISLNIVFLSVFFSLHVRHRCWQQRSMSMLPDT